MKILAGWIKFPANPVAQLRQVKAGDDIQADGADQGVVGTGDRKINRLLLLSLLGLLVNPLHGVVCSIGVGN